MPEQTDGSIIVGTEMDTAGFKAGSAELLAAIKSFSEEVKNLSAMLKELFAKPLTPEVDTGGAEKQVAALKAQVQELEAAMKEMRGNAAAPGQPAAPKADTGGTAQNAPRIEMSGAVQKASDLQKQIEGVNSSVGRLEPTFQKAMSGSESAMTAFEGKASALENKIAVLQERLEAVGQTQYPTEAYQEIGAEIEKTGQKLESLLNKQEKMRSLGVEENSAQWKNLQYDLDVVSQKYDRLEAAKARMESSGGAFQMGADTTQYTQMEAALSAAADRLAEMRSGIGDADAQMGQLSDSAGSAASHISRAAKAAAGTLVRGIKAAAVHMAKLVLHGRKMSGQFGGLISGAKKFALSLLSARGIYALLRKAVSAYMAENQQLSDTLSACWSGIGNLLGPIITKLINLVAQAVAYVTSFLQLFGLFGKSAAKAIGNAGDAASGAAKDLKNQLASIDELNVLSDGSDSSGGGSGKESAVQQPDVTLPDWAKLTAQQLKAGDWAAAAATLATQLNGMIAGVDWAAIGKKLGYYLNGALTALASFIRRFDWKGLASGLAEALGGLLDSVDWGNLGTVLTAKWAIILQALDGFFSSLNGESVSKALTDFMYGTVNAADWTGIATSLARNISKFFSDIDFSALAQALSAQIRAVLQSMSAAIANFDWAMIGGKIADLLNDADWSGMFSDLVQLLGRLLTGALELLVGFVGKVDWVGLAEEIWACLESLTRDIDWDNFGALLGKGIGGAVTGVLDLLAALFTDHDWGAMIRDLLSGIGNALGAAVRNIDWAGLLKSLSVALAGIITQLISVNAGIIGGISDILASLFEAIGLDSVAGFFKGIGDAMRSVGTWLKENLVDPVVNWVKNLFGIHSPSTVFAEIGGFLIQGLLQGVSAAWSGIAEFFTGAFKALSERISAAWDGIRASASAAWGGIKSSLSSVWKGIKSTAASTWDGLKSTVSKGWNSTKTATSDTWSNVKSATASAWSGIQSALSGTWSKIRSTASSAFGEIKSTIENKGWHGVGSNICSGISNGISSGWSWLRNTVGNLAGGLLRTAKRALGIHSPSRVFRDEVGLNIGLGIGAGVEEAEPDILRSVAGVADAIAEEVNSGDYTLADIAPTAEVSGALSDFTGRIADSFSTMLEKLQAIADSVTFTVPAVAEGTAVPHSARTGGAAARSGGYGGEADTGGLIEAVTLGVYQAVAQALSSNGDDGQPVNIIMNLDGEKIYQNQQKIARRHGYNFGMGAFGNG